MKKQACSPQVGGSDNRATWDRLGDSADDLGMLLYLMAGKPYEIPAAATIVWQLGRPLAATKASLPRTPLGPLLRRNPREIAAIRQDASVI
jgi:hypothetical protein